MLRDDGTSARKFDSSFSNSSSSSATVGEEIHTVQEEIVFQNFGEVA